MTKFRQNKQLGFTIVELLIAIVVIAILAAISIIAYTGIQQRTRDSIRESDVATIEKALELYYTEKGSYPTSVSCGSSAINSHWCTTADTSWNELEERVVEVGLNATLPRDPTSESSRSPTGGGRNYAYFSYTGERCGSLEGQWYFLVYAREAEQIDNRADCSAGTSLPSYGAASERLVTR